MHKAIYGMAVICAIPLQQAKAASYTTFTTQASFLQAAGQTKLETFNSQNPGQYSTINTSGFNLTSSDSRLTVTGIDYFGTGRFVTANGSSTSSVTFSFLEPVYALGFSYTTGSATSLSISGIGEITGIPISGFPNLAFFGVVSDTAFTSATFRDQNAGLDIENVLTAGATATAVPEVGTWLMMLMGFALIGGTARYRRRNSVVLHL